MLNGKVMARAEVIDKVGLASGSVSRTAGGAAMYEALETIAANTVQPPTFRPARWPSTTPTNPWMIGIKYAEGHQERPDLLQVAQSFAGDQPHLQEKNAQRTAKDHPFAIEELVERHKALRGHEIRADETNDKQTGQQHDRLASDHLVQGTPQVTFRASSSCAHSVTELA